MKLIGFALFLLCLCFTQSLSGQTTTKTDKLNRKAQEELLSIERQRSEAIARHDMEYLDKLYTDDFRGVTALGYEVNKKRLMDVFKLDNPRVKFELDELQARVFDKTAIVTGRLTGMATANNELVHESRYIHVYVKRGGRWQLIAGQGTMARQQSSSN